MKRTQAIFYSSYRFYFLITCLLLGGSGLVWRLVDLTVFDRDFLKVQGDARSLRVTPVPAYRGMIKDRNGEPLAISTPVYSVWANPQQVHASGQSLDELARLLDMPVKSLRKKLGEHTQSEFLYLKRSMTPAEVNKIHALKLKGIYAQQEFKRFYPEGEITAHLIGFTNVDDEGQEGVELAFNDWLKGIPGKKRVHKNRLGQVIQELEVLKPPRPGHDLILSIDRRIQFIAYRALQSALQKFKVMSGTVVVLDAKTGEVLAMVNHPSYNPNKRPARTDGKYRNRAVTDLFEPGSVIKSFTVAAALDSGLFQPETKINTSPGWMVIGSNTIRDIHHYGELTVSEVLKLSSNVGVAKMILAIPPANYVNLLKRAGFGRSTNSGFPGESEGVITEQTTWRDHTLATLAFGYSLAITPLQLAQAYSIFTGDGKLKPISLLKLHRPYPARSVLKPEISQSLLNMMESAVGSARGTGHKASIVGYRVAGKTGTSRMAAPGGYYTDRHIGSFVGIAPVSDPRVIIAVVMQDPQGSSYYGGAIAAPVFSEVLTEVMRILDVPPDKPNDNMIRSTVS